ncbi:hypothetical protein [Streptomyces sp. NPDC001380]|uniref:hypothetical protein n=1 Tax=Streptomyces sp. NPDC001380 TaxID=3364566 RepID=UPI0036B2602E
MAGTGYQVKIDNLREFAARVRGLLAEFEAGAGGDRVHAGSGVAASSFGLFPEARRLDERYGIMRDALRDVLDTLHQALGEAQRNAEATARNYEEQEHGTAAAMRRAAADPSPSSQDAPPTPAEAQQGGTW